MRLQFNPTQQIIFQKYSNDRMGGYIEIRNPSSDIIYSLKIKCTNPQLFQVHPLKAVLKSGESCRIQFTTMDPVNLDFAKQLVMNHKFLIEYVPVTSEYTVPNYKSHEAQKKKYYLNMDSIRTGSRLLKDNDKMSVHSEISNKMSYISMKNQMKKQQVKAQIEYSSTKKIQFKNNNNQQMQQKYSRLKQQLDDLHRQRQQIVNKMSNTRKQSKFNFKKIIVFIIFLLIGSILGKGINKFLQYRQEQIQQQRKRLAKKQQTWSFFGFFDDLYDEVDV